MARRRSLSKTAVDSVSFEHVAEDMCRDYFRYYLYLSFSPPSVLKRGYEALCEYWGFGFNRKKPLALRAIKGLEKKGYVGCFYAENRILPTKIRILKRLAIPVSQNFVFIHPQAKTNERAIEALNNEVLDSQRDYLKKKLRLVNKKSKNKKSEIVTKQTSKKAQSHKSPGKFVAKRKEKLLKENEEKYKIKTENLKGEQLVTVTVKSFHETEQRKIFIHSEKVRITVPLEKYNEDFWGWFVPTTKNSLTEYKNNGAFMAEYSCTGQGKTSLFNKFFKHKDKQNEHGHVSTPKGVSTNIKEFNFNTTFKHNSLCKNNVVESRIENDSDFTSNIKKKKHVLKESRKRQENEKVKHTSDSRHRESGSGCDEVFKVAQLRKPDIVPQNAMRKARRMNLQKVKTSYVEDKKARVAGRKKQKNVSEQDVWAHIQRKNLDIFSPQVDRQKLLEILALPKKSQTRKELIAEIGKKFSEIYYAYRQKLSEATKTRNTYSSKFEANLEFAKKAAEACIQYGVTPQFLIQYFHENRSRFSSELKYVPLSILSNAAMVDSAASAYLGQLSTVEHGNEYAEINKLHPQLRSNLEKAGFPTQKYSDQFLMTVQIAAIDVAEGYKFFIPGEIREMVHWAAKNIFRGSRP